MLSRGLREGKLRSVLKGNYSLLTQRERHAVAELLHEHPHLFRNWPPPGSTHVCVGEQLVHCALQLLPGVLMGKCFL